MTKTEKVSFRVRFCIGCVVFALLFAFVVFMPEFPRLAPYAAPKDSVSLFRSSEAKPSDMELIALYDDSPIFLSTRVNFSDFESELPRNNLSDFEPDEKSELTMQSYADDIGSRKGELSIMNMVSKSYAFSGFMQNSADAQIPEAYPLAVASLKVMSSDANASVFAEVFELKSVSAGSLWVPVEFSVIVSSDNAASMPMMLSSSGIDSLDSELAKYIASNLYRMKLKTGYYTITVSP